GKRCRVRRAPQPCTDSSGQGGRDDRLIQYLARIRAGMRGLAEMAERDEHEGADPSHVAACVCKLNHTVGELATLYGVGTVVIALTEVMGCSSCVTDIVERGASIRALVERLEVGR